MPVVAVGLLALLIVAMVRGRVNVSVTIDADGVHVRPHGLDVLWCLSSGVTVPIEAVEGTQAVPTSALPPRGFRLPGSYIPGVITAGSYGTGDNRTFWDVRRGDPVLVITCTEGSPYRQIVLEVDDARATAARLRSRLMAR